MNNLLAHIRLLTAAFGPNKTITVPDDVLFERCAAWLETISPREKQILALSYGLYDNKPLTLEEVSRLTPAIERKHLRVNLPDTVTRERVRQVHAKALRKLRHPTRGRPIRGILAEE